MVKKTTKKTPRTTSARAKKVVIKQNKDGVAFANLDGIQIEEGFNVRRNVSPEPELVASVKENGVMNPVHVRWGDRKKTTLFLIDGERRYNAAREAGAGAIPILHHGFIGDKEAFVISLAANENQKKLTRKERIEGFRRLKEKGLSPAEIASVMGVDGRTVSESLKVDAMGSRELKRAAKQGPSKGGVAPRAAARAAHLPKAEQKKLVKKMAGKPLEDQIEEVRKTEKRLGVTRPGRKKDPAKPKARPKTSSRYVLADDAEERCKAIDKALQKKLRFAPSHKVHTGQMMVVQCLRGKCNVSDIFGWKDV
jgi:ParB/RepB/Spo0J family partition protein